MSERLNFEGMLIGDRLRLLLDGVGAQTAIHGFDSCSVVVVLERIA
jgi:hypothetical protein